MTVAISYFAGAGVQFFDNSGNVLSGGKLYTYEAGTTTPLTTYTSSSGLVANSNPIVMNSAGRTPDEIWLTVGTDCKFVLKTSDDVLLGTYDNIPAVSNASSLANFIADLANTTSATKGDALVGFKQSDPTGLLPNAVARTVHQKLQDIKTLKDFGAVGDGVTDDKTAIENALSSGFIIDGGGLTYAINGTCTPTSFVGLQNANFIQLAPTTPDVATLELEDISNFFIDNVNFDMGSTTDTGLDDSSRSALRIQSSVGGTYVSNYKLTRISVTGDGNGSRFRIHNSKQFIVDNCSVYDCYAGYTPDPTNDIMNGFDFGECADFAVSNLVVKNLNVRKSGVYVRGGRGILIAECSDFDITNCNVTDVDQSYDFSGTVITGTTPSYFVGNRRWTMSNCVSNNTYSWAFKFANVTREGLVTGCVANNAGFGGFVFSAPPISGVPNWAVTQDIQVVGCRVNNVLKSGGSNSHGFRILNTPTYPTYPRSIRIVGCHVADTQNTPTTEEAYVVDGNDIVVFPAAGYDTSISNTITNCTANEKVGTFSSGLSPNFCSVTGTSTQSISNAAWTNVNWDTNFYDYQGLHSTTSDNEAVNIKMAGWYRVDAKVMFSANATGSRGIRLTKNTNEIDRSRVINIPSGIFDTTIFTSFVTFFDRSDRIRVEVYQNSGGALNIDQTQSSFIVTKIDG